MPTSVYGSLCIKCKGLKRLCSLPECPLLKIYRSRLSTYERISLDSLEGSTPPSILVGEYGYPKVRIMLNIPPGVHGDKARIYDSPQEWWGKYNLDDIITLRTSLVGSVVRSRVRDVWRLYEREINISSVSVKPVDIEAKLSDRPRTMLRIDPILKPVGPTVDIEKIKVASSPKLGKLLEKMIVDDLKASQAIKELYLSGYSRYTIINALSSGLLGRLRDKKLVPTRWAITAVDSILGDFFRKEAHGKPYINKVEVYTGEYLDNRFTVILAPGPLQLEWIEAWHPGSVWSRGKISYLRLYEDYRGRYESMDGGYMAARLSVLEYLYKRGRQATVFIFREVGPRYIVPVGNWHIRETVKKILEKTPQKFDNIDEVFREGLDLFQIHPDTWSRWSKLYKDIKSLRRITDYL